MNIKQELFKVANSVKNSGNGNLALTNTGKYKSKIRGTIGFIDIIYSMSTLDGFRFNDFKKEIDELEEKNKICAKH